MDYVAATGVGVAVVLGVIAIYYARFGRKQHDLDYGLKKAEVCSAIERVLDVVLQTGQAPRDVLTPFNRATEPNTVGLLFDSDGCAYIAELRTKAQELWTLGALETGMPDGERKRSLTMKRLDLAQWMSNQLGSELKRRLGCQQSIGRP